MCWFDVFFFFKQKTAYEMRISDWSSDVCSSDLGDEGAHGTLKGYMTGFLLSVVLTAIPFWIVMGDVFRSPETATLVVLIFAFAIGRASCRERVCQYV